MEEQLVVELERVLGADRDRELTENELKSLTCAGSFRASDSFLPMQRQHEFLLVYRDHERLQNLEEFHKS